jgi:hypothetical protein
VIRADDGALHGRTWAGTSNRRSSRILDACTDYALEHGLPDRLAPLEDGMRSLGRPELATVVLAVIRGLLMDLAATGDTERTHQAFNDFLATIDHACPAAPGRVNPGRRPELPRTSALTVVE